MGQSSGYSVIADGKYQCARGLDEESVAWHKDYSAGFSAKESLERVLLRDSAHVTRRVDEPMFGMGLSDDEVRSYA
jgi:hypothetical protein